MALDPKSDVIKFVPKRITINFIPQEDQRYATVGDWFNSGQIDNKIINVSKMDIRYEYLVAIHELIELALCDLNGISAKQVDAFDLSHLASEEPGMESDCPYRWQHLLATGIEMQLAAVMDIDWKGYEEYLDHVVDNHPRAT